MSSRGTRFSQKVKDYWKIVMISLSAITIVVVAFTTDFRTFIFFLAAILLVVPLILLLTSGFCSDVKFFAKRFEHLPEDDRPIIPGRGGGAVGRTGPAHSLHAPLIEAHRSIKKTGTSEMLFFHRLSGNIAKMDYNSSKMRKYILTDFSEEIQSELTENQKTELTHFIKEHEKLETIIDKLDGQNVKKFFDTNNDLNYQFNFQKNSNLSFLQAVIIEMDLEGRIKIESIFDKYQPFSLSLTDFEMDEKDREQINIPELSKIYSIDYSHPKVFEQLLEEEIIIESLYSLHSTIDSFLIDKKYFLAMVTDIEKIPDVFSALKIINKRLISEVAGLIDVEKIRCYKCNEILGISDRTCPNCGEKRPECGVCLLDLYPSETQEVVKTSCCGIYAHKYHLIMWLDKTDKCPNCRTRKPRWVKFLDS